MMYYDVNPILNLGEKKKCPTVVIVGGKGNGKTFGILAKYLVEFLKTGRVLRYLRRYRESITPKAIQSLLKPQRQNLINLSKGKYNDFTYYRSRFYLVRKDELGNTVEKKQEPFIVCSALNAVESFTGADEGECSAIFFDEFLSREKELQDEFTTLMIFHDNAVRNRIDKYTPLILVGNTVSRNSTLARDFGIDLYSINQGEVTSVYNSKKEIIALVEHCPPVQVMEDAGNAFYKRYETSKIKMIYTGDWSVGNYPRIKKRYIDSSDVFFRFLVKSPSKPLLITLRQYHNYVFGYVSEFKDEAFDMILTTEVTPIGVNIINYFASKVRCFSILGYLMVRKHLYFESGEVGELYRDFLSRFTGAEQFLKLYK